MEIQPMNQYAAASSSSSSSNIHHDNGDGSSMNHVPIFDLFPPGYRFNPRGEELVVYYLKRKVLNEQLPPNKIIEVNLYGYNPATLADMYKPQGEREWYFFTPRDRKYRNGNRPSRSVVGGYWKATGADKAIKSNGNCVGFRKALVFYKGRTQKGDKTSWIMHEFRVNMPSKRRSGTDMRLDDCVLCRIYNKKDKAISLRARQYDDESPTQQSDDAIVTQELHGQPVPVGESPMLSNGSSTQFNQIEPLTQQLDDAMETQELHGQLVPVGELPMLPNENSPQFNQIEPLSYKSNVQELHGQTVPVGESPMPSNGSSTQFNQIEPLTQQLDDAMETQELDGQLVPVGELPVLPNENSTQFNQIEPLSYNSKVDPMAFFNPSEIGFSDRFQSRFAEVSPFHVPSFEQTPLLNDHYQTMNDTGYNYDQNHVNMVELLSSQLPIFSMESNIRPQLGEYPLDFKERGYQEEHWAVPKLDECDFLTQPDFNFD